MYFLGFQIPIGSLVQLRIVSVSGICPASNSFVVTGPPTTTSTSTTTIAPACVSGTNTCTPFISGNPGGTCYPGATIATVTSAPFGGSGCNQTILWGLLGDNCKCVSAVFLDHRQQNWLSWTQSSPAATNVQSGFLNICNILSLYATPPVATFFEIRLRVFFTDGSTSTSPTYVVAPSVEYLNTSTFFVSVSGWSDYCVNWSNNFSLAPGNTVCFQGGIFGGTSFVQAIGYC